MAIQVVREVSADVVKRGSTRAVYAKQNDKNSRFLNVRIQEEGKDIKVDSASTVILNVERPDKQENMFYGTVNEDGTVKIPMASWMLELEGTLLCDVSIVYEGSNDAKLTTMQFSIYVEAAVVKDETFIDTEEYSVIVDLLNRTTEAEKLASSAAADAQTLREACEDSAEKAYDAADKANKVRENVEAGGYIESLKELNNGSKFSVWIGTTAEYGSLGTKRPNCLYILTDEPSLKDVAGQESTEFPGCFYRMVDGEQEWINPPLEDGVLYRTTERYNGNPVYIVRKYVEIEVGDRGIIIERAPNRVSPENYLDITFNQFNFEVEGCMSTPSAVSVSAHPIDYDNGIGYPNFRLYAENLTDKTISGLVTVKYTTWR